MHLGSLNTLGLNWFSPGRSGVSRAMAKRSWPFGVTSWDDTVKFARLLFGADVAFENYAERMPHRSDKSFLLCCYSPKALVLREGLSSRLEI